MPKFAVMDAPEGVETNGTNGTEQKAERAGKTVAPIKLRSEGGSVFDRGLTFTRYHVELQVRGQLMGGIPRDPKIVEGWLRTKMGLSDKGEELRQYTIKTLIERGVEGVSADMSFEELEKISKQMAGEKQTNGFKASVRGLYLESRAIKAGLKEWINIGFAGGRWGPTNKGPKSFAAERVFVDGDEIALGRQEPDGVHLFIGHTSGPQGPKSNLTQYEYVERPRLSFDLLVFCDAIEPQHWPVIWTLGQENGIGALRSQGFGRFDVEAWEQVDGYGITTPRFLELERKAKAAAAKAGE